MSKTPELMEYKSLGTYSAVAKINDNGHVFWRYRNFGNTLDFEESKFRDLEEVESLFSGADTQ